MSAHAARRLDAPWPGRLQVIQDGADLASLPIESALNCVVLGDAVSVLEKLDPEIADCVFFDPPYFLQLSGRQLKRWGVRTAVGGRHRCQP